MHTLQPPQPTLDIDLLLESWCLQLRSDRKSPETVKSYRDGVIAFKRWCERTGRPTTLSRRNMQEFRIDLLEALEPTTVMARHLACRYFSAWLLEEKEIPVDELAGMKGPKIDSKIVQPYSVEELKRLLGTCAGGSFVDKRDEAVIRFLAESGARASEVVGMLLSETTPIGGTTKLRGKGGRERVAPFGPFTAKALDRYIRVRRTHRLAATDALWLGGGGKGFSYKGMYCALGLRAQEAGIQGFHPHRFRHTMADRWLGAGGSELGLMAVAGWQTSGMVQRYVRGRQSVRAVEESRRLNLGDL